MHIDLSGRTALVTGSTAGIGFAIAAGLLESGATVVVNGRTTARVDEARAQLEAALPSSAGRIRGVAADVGTADGCDALIAAEPDVDILVNNAGVFNLQPVFEIPDSEWQRLYEVNVLSGVRLSRHYVPRMVDRGWGRTIFISSESAIQIPAEMVHYGMTKTAQLAVSRGIAETVSGSGVTVNCVLPGPTLSEGVGKLLEDELTSGRASSIEEAGAAFIASARPTSLLGRPTDPAEVANLVVYLSSEQASATTGSALRVDGGVVRAVA
jgi:NAD(P)-dependent dehydrogenase (short-subunit alcohol dehydrogenase family)